MRRKKNLKFKIILSIFFITILLIGIGYAKTSQVLNITGKVKIEDSYNDINIKINRKAMINEYYKYRYIYKITVSNNSKEYLKEYKILISNLPTDCYEFNIDWKLKMYSNEIENGRIILCDQNYDWDRGIVAKGKRTFEITFISRKEIKNNEIKSKIYKVDADENIQKIQIKDNNFNIGIGESKKIDIQTVPTNKESNVNWKTSDENIAVVTNDGTVTGISEGTATITAFVNDILEECIVHIISENRDKIYE